jgi:hypothetical protein
MMGALFFDPFHLFDGKSPVAAARGLTAARYPNGFLGSPLQLMSYYAERRGGFYIACHDRDGADKDLSFYKSPDDTGSVVARELGCLALALEQAGAYMEKLRLSFTDYLQRWWQQRPAVLRWHDERLIEYPASVAITWETTFAQLSEPQQNLLQVLAWLEPEPIPLFCFESPALAAAIPEPREALAGLADFSLARFETESDAVVIHRLVQVVARGRGDAAGREASLRTALDTMD